MSMSPKNSSFGKTHWHTFGHEDALLLLLQHGHISRLIHKLLKAYISIFSGCLST